MQVTNAQIVAYDNLVSSLARRFAGRANAEYDDLFQEGRIAVFLSLKRGIHPAREIIENRMRDYIRFCSRLERLESADYGRYLPMEIPNEPVG